MKTELPVSTFAWARIGEWWTPFQTSVRPLYFLSLSLAGLASFLPQLHGFCSRWCLSPGDSECL